MLIDEAQDTSPKQWDIVERMIADFTTGEGAREALSAPCSRSATRNSRSFRFRARPRANSTSGGASWSRHSANAELPFRKENFIYSFRSGKTILERSTMCSAIRRSIRSIHAVGAHPVHESLADAAPGIVDLWNLEERDEREEIEGWRAPFDEVTATSPEVKLARRIRAAIKALITQGTMTGHLGDRRPLGYGDILVLVRRRGNAFDAVIQALKQSGIPVAGADRLKLTEHIAIIDLMNLADALLLPQDDLALASGAEKPAVRPRRRRPVHAGMAAQRLAARRARRACAQLTINSATHSSASKRAKAAPHARRRSRSLRGSWAARERSMAATANPAPARRMRPTTRSTNFSNSR